MLFRSRRVKSRQTEGLGYASPPMKARRNAKHGPRNALYAQSGGVTAVINATAAGVIEACRKHRDRIGKLYAGRDGIVGALFVEVHAISGVSMPSYFTPIICGFMKPVLMKNIPCPATGRALREKPSAP